MSLREVKRDTSSDQSRLNSFGTSGTTYVGIVNRANDEFESAVDEIEPRLAPPDRLFYHWLNEKEQRESDMSSVRAHNEAVEEIGYRTRYRKFLRANDDARIALHDLAQRIADGEHIVVVCYCGENMWCHREVVTERLKSMVDE